MGTAAKATAARSLVPLADAAHMLGMTTPMALRRLLLGELDGEREPRRGRWMVTRESCEQYLATRERSAR